MNLLIQLTLFTSLFTLTTPLKSPKVFNYEDILDFTETVKNDPKFFRVFDAADRYYIKRIDCGDSPCSFPVIELTNFNNGLEHISSLPTILLISGFSGEDLLSINLLIAFAHLMRHKDGGPIDPVYLLNNFRFLIVPMANPNGVYNKGPFEHNSNIGKRLQPLKDFDIYKPRLGRCFESFSSKVLYRLFREELIVGVLVFQKGDFLIGHPWSDIKGAKSQTSDIRSLRTAGEQFAEYLNNKQREFAMEFSSGSIVDFGDKVSGGKRGFEDWAFSASWNGKRINKQCIPKGMNPDYPYESNRAVVFLLQTGLDDLEKTQNWILDLKIEVFSGLIEKFAEFIRPRFELDQVTFDHDKDTVDVVVKFKGCLSLSGPVITNRAKYGKITKIETKQNFEQIVQFTLKDIAKEKLEELKFNFFCDERWKSDSLDRLPESHVLKMRFDPNYHVDFGKNKFKNLRNFEYSVYNINSPVRDANLADIYNAGLFSEVQYEEGLYAYFFHFTLKLTKDRFDDYVGIKPILKLPDAEISTDVVDYIAVKEYGEIGCCGPASLGSNIALTTDLKFEINQISDFYSFIGRTIEVKFEGKEKPLRATIEYLGKEGGGYSMPPSGVTCSSLKYDRATNYYYTKIEQKDKRLFITIYTTNSKVYEVGFLDHSFTPFIIGSFETEKFGLVYEYDLTISNYKEVNSKDIEKMENFDFISLSSRLRGKRFYFIDNKGTKVFSCSLGVKNPYYNEIDNLRYNMKNYDINEKISKNGIFLYLMSLSLIVIVLGAVGTLICFTIFKKRREQIKMMFKKFEGKV